MLYDVAWSELHEGQLLVAMGDGSIKLFDRGVDDYPVQNWKEHRREVQTVNWNPVNKEIFCSGSWDGTVRIWSPHRTQSITTIPIHSCVYSATFSPHDPNIVSAVTSDSTVRIFDLRTPTSASNHLVLTFPNHHTPNPSLTRAPGVPPTSYTPSEVLTHDWNKYRQNVLATGAVDSVARTFDLRALQSGPVSTMAGHTRAIKKLAWSPHHATTLLTASYDMTCRVWNDLGERPPPASGPTAPMRGQQVGQMNTHSEFVTGVDWCLFGGEGWCASVGYDANLYVWDVNEVIRRSS